MFTTELRWVSEVEPMRLALMPRPRGGEWLADEVTAWHRIGLAAVVSLLEPSEIRELELKEERSLCEQAGIEFLSLPIPDRGVPSSIPAVRSLVNDLVVHLREGRSVAIHCRAGIGRTGVIAGCLLRRLGMSQEAVFPALTRARGVRVPDTDAQVEWVKRNFAGGGNAL